MNDRDEIEIRDLVPDDVPSLIACVRSCYGESYTEPEFYDPALLRADLDKQRLLSVGALVGGRIVGHLGTRIAHSGDSIADTVGGIVDPTYRGRGLTSAMGAHMVSHYGSFGIAGVRHLSTGAHDRTQRLIVASGGVATGVLLGHVASRTEYRGIEHEFGNARIGVVVYFQAYAPLGTLEVFVNDRYAYIAELYDALRLERDIHVGSPRAGSLDHWPGSLSHDTRRGISTLRFGVLAAPSTAPATEALQRIRAHGEPVVYADLPLTDPLSAAAVDVLVGKGFYFGALLPGSATTEAIRLQRTAPGVVAPEAIATASPGGGALLRRITDEYHRHRREGSDR